MSTVKSERKLRLLPQTLPQPFYQLLVKIPNSMHSPVTVFLFFCCWFLLPGLSSLTPAVGLTLFISLTP